MDILNSLWAGFAVAALPINLALIVGGCFAGTLIGALPGLGPVNGVAILIPLTFAFGLDATSSMILLSAVYYGCMYGGRISAILLNIPGDEPAIMTTLDGFPMARKGQAADALAISGVASFIGATLATIGLTLFAPLLAKRAVDRLFYASGAEALDLDDDLQRYYRDVNAGAQQICLNWDANGTVYGRIALDRDPDAIARGAAVKWRFR